MLTCTPGVRARDQGLVRAGDGLKVEAVQRRAAQADLGVGVDAVRDVREDEEGLVPRWQPGQRHLSPSTRGPSGQPASSAPAPAGLSYRTPTARSPMGIASANA